MVKFHAPISSCANEQWVYNLHTSFDKSKPADAIRWYLIIYSVGIGTLSMELTLKVFVNMFVGEETIHDGNVSFALTHILEPKEVRNTRWGVEDFPVWLDDDDETVQSLRKDEGGENIVLIDKLDCFDKSRLTCLTSTCVRERLEKYICWQGIIKSVSTPGKFKNDFNCSKFLQVFFLEGSK